MILTPGSRLGPYEIVGSLGAGGMGEVWSARDTRLDREVAIKVLPEGLAQNEQFRARIEREAKSISSLNHPNICTLHDIGRQEGVFFLVMEKIEGESLADRLVKGPLPLDQVLRIGAEIAAGLDAAHRRGIVHRDLKPGNIMLTRTGAKLLDFGLAKTGIEAVAPVEGLTSLPTEHRPLTQEGMILGTFQYMAPEQLEGQETDARTDLFALGAVLYEMATGKRAFAGKNKTSLIAAIVSSQPPPISSVMPVSPPALDHVVRKCLEKDPEDRWQSAHDVATQLRWISEAGSQAGVAAPITLRRKSRERLAWITAGLLALLATVGFGIPLLNPVEAPRPIFASIVPQAKTQFQLTEGDAGSLTVSPDGRYVTFLAKGEDGRRLLYLRSLSSGETHPLTGTEGAVFPFWSHDSRFIAFFAEGKLQKVDIGGGPPLALCDVGQNPRRGSWNQDDVIIFSPSSLDSIHRISASGGTPTQVTKLDTAKSETTHRWATFLPDGQHFLYMAGTHAAGARSEANAVYLGDLMSGESRLLLRARSNVEYADGHLLYVRDKVLVAQPFDEKSLSLAANPVPVAEEVQYASGYFYAAFSVSKNGVLVYRTGGEKANISLEWVDLQGKEAGVISGFPPGAGLGLGYPVLSPDGGRLAFSLEDPQSGRNDVWTLDLVLGVSTRLTFGAGDEQAPCWSPDGKRIMYSRLDGASLNLYTKASDGGGGESPVVESGVHKVAFDWSRDGRFVVVGTLNPAAQLQNDLFMLSMGAEPKLSPFLQTAFQELSPRFSPDGRWLAYWSDESGSQALYVTPFPGPGGKYQIASDGDDEFGAQWGPGGGEIYYVSRDSALTAVSLTPRGEALEIGAPRKLFQAPPFAFWVISRDGKRFIVGRQPEALQSTPITLLTQWTAKPKN
ncbi:MAG: serine/threonine-protein kinase [Acidobacteria bacterium]|nr:serine/threonine-protein kinase [Acidobacteriota bacterium]